jgi:surface protein
MFSKALLLYGTNRELVDLSNWASLTYSEDYESMINIPSDGYKYLNSVDSSNNFSMFKNCSELTYIDTSKLHTKYSESMKYMFLGCSSVETLDLSKLDTRSCLTMEGMFEYCSSLTSLDCSNFDTSNCTSFKNMFTYCSNLETLDVSGWDTSSAVNMYGIFGSNDVHEYSEIAGINDWDVSNCTDFQYAFNHIHIPILDLSEWYLNTTSIQYMFAYVDIDILDISNFSSSATSNTVFTVANIDYLIIDSSTQNLSTLIFEGLTGKNSSTKILVPSNLLTTYNIYLNSSSGLNTISHARKRHFYGIEYYNIDKTNNTITITENNPVGTIYRGSGTIILYSSSGTLGTLYLRCSFNDFQEGAFIQTYANTTISIGFSSHFDFNLYNLVFPQLGVTISNASDQNVDLLSQLMKVYMATNGRSLQSGYYNEIELIVVSKTV